MSEQKIQHKKQLPLNTKYEPMSDEVWRLWYQFVKTGSPSDYHRYRVQKDYEHDLANSSKKIKNSESLLF